MLKKIQLSLTVSILCLLLSYSISPAGVNALDGTIWMYEHESGARHYIAFYSHYHYLNSTGSGDEEPDSMWLRSTLPYFTRGNPVSSSPEACDPLTMQRLWRVCVDMTREANSQDY